MSSCRHFFGLQKGNDLFQLDAQNSDPAGLIAHFIFSRGSKNREGILFIFHNIAVQHVIICGPIERGSKSWKKEETVFFSRFSCKLISKSSMHNSSQHFEILLRKHEGKSNNFRTE